MLERLALRGRRGRLAQTMICAAWWMDGAIRAATTKQAAISEAKRAVMVILRSPVGLGGDAPLR